MVVGEQVVDLLGEALDVAPGVVHQGALVGPQPLVGARVEHAQPGPGRRERRAQIVGDVRDEVGPGPVELLEALGLVAHRPGLLLLEPQPADHDRHADPEQGKYQQPGDQGPDVPRAQWSQKEREVDRRDHGRRGGRVEQGAAQRHARGRAVRGQDKKNEQQPAGLPPRK